eukprot:COSAG02_NODE_20732_length_817_cov_1.473538_2_plen_66_part_00
MLRSAALLTTAALLLAHPQHSSAGIFPEDHWEHSTKLTTATFNSWITEEVDAGRTAMVRWIASEG